MPETSPARLYAWNDVKREEVNPTFARRLVWGEKVMLAQLELKTGAIVPTHRHDNEQLSMCYTGAIRLVLGENEEQDVVLRAGDVLVIPGGVPHRAEVLEDFTGLDVFSPPREDWISGDDSYLRR